MNRYDQPEDQQRRDFWENSRQRWEGDAPGQQWGPPDQPRRPPTQPPNQPRRPPTQPPNQPRRPTGQPGKPAGSQFKSPGQQFKSPGQEWMPPGQEWTPPPTQQRQQWEPPAQQRMPPGQQRVPPGQQWIANEQERRPPTKPPRRPRRSLFFALLLTGILLTVLLIGTLAMVSYPMFSQLFGSNKAQSLVTPTRVVTPTPTPFDPSVGAILPSHRIVAFYGIPNAEPPGPAYELTTDMLNNLQAQGAAYQQLDPSLPVQLGIDLVASVADGFPGPNGYYSHDLDPDTIQAYIDFCQKNNLILF